MDESKQPTSDLPPTANPQSAIPNPNSAEFRNPKSEIRILIVEDLPRDADLATRELQRAGIECETRIVDTREAMMRELAAFAPDLILSDYSMPKFTGIEALEIRNQYAPGLPFVILTASISEETAVECIKRGADDYILKDRLSRLPHAIHSTLTKVRLERARREAQAQVGLAAQQWRMTFDAMRDAVALLDPGQRILRCNKAMRELADKPWEGLIGHPCCVAVHEIPEPPPECPAVRASRSRKRETWQTSLGDRCFDVIADPVLNAEGELTGIVHVLVDITERKRLEAEKDALEAQLRQAQKLEAIGRLAGGVAHDFNNMLSIILGNAEMALQRLDLDEELQGDLQEIVAAAGRSRNINRQLLAFARRQAISPEVVDLNQAVEGMLKMLRRLLGEDLELVWTPGSGLWPVMIDPSQIDQILANLSVNARDAIANVGKLSIVTENVVLDEGYCHLQTDAVSGDYVSLAVCDSGCGMTKEIQERVFEPFFTTKDPGKGTGLGLSTVYGIVKQNRGFVNVYSEPGQGTTFRIYLPRHAVPAAESPKDGEPELPRGQGETVLVAEDEVPILRLVARTLVKLGYTVLAASTPGEALRLAEEYSGEIHLLITDVVMPEMNGRQLAERLHPRYPNLKRLFMTGYAPDTIADRGVLGDGLHLVQKPFTVQVLAAKVRAVLEAPS